MKEILNKESMSSSLFNASQLARLRGVVGLFCIWNAVIVIIDGGMHNTARGAVFRKCFEMHEMATLGTQQHHFAASAWARVLQQAPIIYRTVFADFDFLNR
jgi:hypothetical protein